MGTVICIGGGPAGLTAAYELVKNRQDVIVLEAHPDCVGGIARTVNRDGFCFDIGGHRFFSKSSEITALWKEILGNDLLARSRKSRIYYGGKFYPYPLDTLKTLKNLGPLESLRCLLSYFNARLFPCPDPNNFEEWVTNQFGARLFRIFFKTYTEKVWGMKCTSIAADWAAQRIKGLSLVSLVKNTFARSLGIKRTNGVKTLIEEFLYPRKGPGMMWERAAEKIRAMGGKIELGSVVTSLGYDAKTHRWDVEYTDVKSNKTHHLQADYVISSMPLANLAQAVVGTPPDIRKAASSLLYRDFLLVALVLRDRQTFDDNWIYIHDPNVQVGRIQNFKSWSPEMVPDPLLTVYGMEYFCFEGDGLWTSSDSTLLALAKRELAQIGLGDATDVQKGYIVRQPKAYPAYDQDYKRNVTAIRQWLVQSCPNLQVVGRNGMHKYNNQDHSMMTALLAARNILAGHTRFDVWKVNQDAEYHEEKR